VIVLVVVAVTIAPEGRRSPRTHLCGACTCHHAHQRHRRTKDETKEMTKERSPPVNWAWFPAPDIGLPHASARVHECMHSLTSARSNGRTQNPKSARLVSRVLRRDEPMDGHTVLHGVPGVWQRRTHRVDVARCRDGGGSRFPGLGGIKTSPALYSLGPALVLLR
jgi:hypothetical protein